MFEQPTPEEAANHEAGILFANPQKQHLFESVSQRIIKKNAQTKEAVKDSQEREIIIFGDTFEMVAKEENRLQHTETEPQRGVREIIENIYQNAELILGTAHERPSKPDGISVGFDAKGRLIINEIVEMKTSENAFRHGIDKDQPAKTLNTIGHIVTILNRLAKGENTSNIKPLDHELPFDKRVKRDGELKKIKDHLISIIGTGNTITFSPEMIYRLIVPNGQEIPTFNPDLLQEEGFLTTTLKISHSEFSKRDIHEIIHQTDSKKPSQY